MNAVVQKFPQRTTGFKIEKNVPLTSARGGSAKYPFSEMEVGDSFHIPSPEFPRLVNSAAYHFGKKRGWKFAFRKQEDGTYRCWRTA